MAKFKSGEIRRASAMIRQMRRSLRKHFEEHGAKTMTTLAEKDSGSYLRFLSEFAVMEASIDPQESLSDDLLERTIAAITGFGGSHAVPAKPEDEATNKKPPQELPPLPKAENLP